jgi:transcriptional regulator with XRE-family HTH domain
MSIRREPQDPCTDAQRQADADVQAAFAHAPLASETRTAALAQARARKEHARARAAQVGEVLGQLRRLAGLTQAEVAAAVGTQRTDLSRLESGRYGGLSVERVVAILDVLEATAGLGLGAFLPGRGPAAPTISDTFFPGLAVPAEGIEGGAR